MRQSSFRIFNASAGSGKTFTLVREYLKIILGPGSKTSFRQILAITFTNKAVAEMKKRILESLFEFATRPSSGNQMPLFLALCKDLSCSPEYLHERSGVILKYLLHNYAFFDVSTIDKFTHRVIRTFSRDLRLPAQFEVVLEETLLMQEAVGQLLSQAGKDPELTNSLVAFSLEKIDAEKSWDISYDLNQMGKLLFDENHLKPLQKLAARTSDDFKALKSNLKRGIEGERLQMRDAAHKAIQIMEAHGLEAKDFTGGYFPRFVRQIHQGTRGLNFDAAWKQNFGDTPLYPKKTRADIQDLLDKLLPEFSRLFTSIRNHFFEAAFLENALGNLVPLAILKAIQKELDLICKERELLPISYFNRIIADEIRDQPAPYIYERIGEKYRHYFIDEFQDTSELQWSNLVPLISNALEGQDESGRKGSLMLVGDAKQAIYRWRGGKAEQFLNLLDSGSNIFTIPPEINDLPRNYRSHEQIIRFNNEFFRITSPVLSNPYYQALFDKGAEQKPNELKGGQVVIDFIDKSGELDLQYGDRIVSYIREVQQKGYRYQDICVLTRKTRHGVRVATHLMERGIPVISSESLLLDSSEEVRFCIALLQLATRPEEMQARFEILNFLRRKSLKAHWSWLYDLELLLGFLRKNFGFDWVLIQRLNAYDALEYSISCFALCPESDAYLSFLLDEALNVAQKQGPGMAVFLSNWEERREKLSVVAPEELNAVKVMTIHKAKGLEFPVVIFPYANSNIYEEKNPTIWTDVDPVDYNGFETLLISKKKEMLQYPGSLPSSFAQEQAKLELDAFNLLYVALTRGISALYVITETSRNKDIFQARYYGDLFVQYLQARGEWDNGSRKFTLGTLPQPETPDKIKTSPHQLEVPFTYSGKHFLEKSLVPKNMGPSAPSAGKALAWGNLFHELMSQVITEADIAQALGSLARGRILPKEELSILESTSRALVSHPELRFFFQEGMTVRNETEIITKNGLILRPDRMVFQNKEVSILDYKTGKKNSKDKEQLEAYAAELEFMGFRVKQKVLAYTGKNIEPLFI